MDLKQRSKSQKGDYPPNPKQWDAETCGMNFRREFSLSAAGPLRPFTINVPRVTLLPRRRDVEEFVSADYSRLLFDVYGDRWSGITIPCAGDFIVILNENHSLLRNAATLMEEYFHILLNHKPIRIESCKKTGLLKREFDREMEDEAYHSAAAALVPYRQLRHMVDRQGEIGDIAGHFEVSEDLVCFRLKTCKLYQRARRN